MLQRIQSLYLLIAGLLVIAYFYFEAWIPQDLARSGNLNSANGFIIGLMSVFTFGSIFLYKNRDKQLRVIKIAQWFFIAWILFEGAVIFFFNVMGQVLTSLQCFVLAIPALGYILCRLAERAIKADVDLLKSADRLR